MAAVVCLPGWLLGLAIVGLAGPRAFREWRRTRAMLAFERLEERRERPVNDEEPPQ